MLNLAGLPPFDTSSSGPSPGSIAGAGGGAGTDINKAPAGAISLADMEAFGGDDMDAGAVGGTCAADTNGSALAIGGADAFPFDESEETEIKKPLDVFDDFSPNHHPVSMPPKMSILDHDYTGTTAARKKRYRNWNPPMLGTLPDDFLRIMVTPEASPTSCPAHPHSHPSPFSQQNSTLLSSPRHHRFSSPHHHLHSRFSVSPSRPTLSRAETLPSKGDNVSSSPKIKNKDIHGSQSSTSKSRTFGFRSRRQKSEADAQRHKTGTDQQLTNTLRKNPLAAAVSTILQTSVTIEIKDFALVSVMYCLLRI